MDVVFNYIYQFLESASFLVLCGIGMAIVYGMMKIVNFAVGQFIMIGAYTAVIFVNYLHCPFPIAILGACTFTALLGMLTDRLILKRLYGRDTECIVATWGLGLILSQGILIIFGQSMKGIEVPFGSFKVGSFIYSQYRFLLILCAALCVAGLYLLMNHTKFGLHARATMQNREMASAMGINSSVMNVSTFMLGSALSGLVGALYAPLQSIAPGMSSNFLTQAFVPVIVGGSNPLVGISFSGLGLGVIEGGTTILSGNFFGKIALLVTAILSVRFLKDGFTSIYTNINEKRSRKRALRAADYGKGILKGGEETCI